MISLHLEIQDPSHCHVSSRNSKHLDMMAAIVIWLHPLEGSTLLLEHRFVGTGLQTREQFSMESDSRISSKGRWIEISQSNPIQCMCRHTCDNWATLARKLFPQMAAWILLYISPSQPPGSGALELSSAPNISLDPSQITVKLHKMPGLLYMLIIGQPSIAHFQSFCKMSGWIR